MAVFKASKVVAALPGVLEASTIYLVKAGAGFDLYATNDQGTIVAYPLNLPAGTVNTATVEIDFTAASPGRMFDVAVAGAALGQKVLASPSLAMPAGVQQDEFEADPFAVAATVIAAGQVRISAVALAGPLKGKRAVTLMLV